MLVLLAWHLMTTTAAQRIADVTLETAWNAAEARILDFLLASNGSRAVVFVVAVVGECAPHVSNPPDRSLLQRRRRRRPRTLARSAPGSGTPSGRARIAITSA